MKTKHPLPIASLALALLSILNPQLSTCFAQGSLTPPDAPAPTMKTLTQIEPRTPISTATNLTQAGSYYLTTNITVASGNAITVSADNVTLDLNGFTIASTEATPTGYGIGLGSGRRRVTILNGCIKGGVTYSGGGYTGPGFAFGIGYSGSAPVNVRVSGVSVSGCQYAGISLSFGNASVVEFCAVDNIGGTGIYADSVSRCSAYQCGSDAISARSAANCQGSCTGSGAGVYGAAASHCYGRSNSGTGLLAETAENCYGYSDSGVGLSATTADNCIGYGNGGGSGLAAFAVATSCNGASETGVGLYAENVAMGCRGYSQSGLGLSAFIANSCRALSVSGTAESITHKYNMP